MKKVLKTIGILLLVIVVAAVGLIGYLTVTEYKPEDTETLEVLGASKESPAIGAAMTVVSWNMGYGALGDNADFFMDGGKMVNTATKDRVLQNTEAIIARLKALEPDIVFLQEADIGSKRSHGINEIEMLSEAFADFETTFAYNFKVPYVPYPIPTIGRVNSGLFTLSRYHIEKAERIKLPCPFSWPVRIANLKRCLSVERIPVQDSDKELVIVNLHLEAYDDGTGKEEQTRVLAEFLQKEAELGNYVIAGGDFNQTFSNVDISMYPAQEGKWASGLIDADAFDDSLQLLMDNRIPSCRSLDQPYVGADEDTFQYYVIDGLIVSSNITVESFETLNYNFENTDHNPVLATITLQ